MAEQLAAANLGAQFNDSESESSSSENEEAGPDIFASAQDDKLPLGETVDGVQTRNESLKNETDVLKTIASVKSWKKPKGHAESVQRTGSKKGEQVQHTVSKKGEDAQSRNKDSKEHPDRLVRRRSSKF